MNAENLRTRWNASLPHSPDSISGSDAGDSQAQPTPIPASNSAGVEGFVLELPFTGRMIVMCAWCREEMGRQRCLQEFDGLVSHTICQRCQDRIFSREAA